MTLHSGESLPYERVLELDFELEQLCTSVNPLYQWNQLAYLQLNKPEEELRAWRTSIVWVSSTFFLCLVSRLAHPGFRQ